MLATRLISATALLLVLTTAGEASAVRRRAASFHSSKDVSQVYIDGKYVGDTPLSLDFPCGEVGDRRYRIEHDSCDPAEGILNARVSPAAIVGAAFSAGISLIFVCPRYFEPVNAHLRCGDAEPETAVPPEALPPRVNLRHEREQLEDAVKSDEEVLARLRMLKDLYRRGVLSESQYRQERDRLIGALEE